VKGERDQGPGIGEQKTGRREKERNGEMGRGRNGESEKGEWRDTNRKRNSPTLQYSITPTSSTPTLFEI